MSESTSVLPTAAVDPDLAPGSTVGEYTIENKLGQGGFGAVFKATHPLIGKVVAVKVLARKFSVDPEMVSRFIAEAKAVNQIRHRNIIDIFSFGQLPDDGRHYYIMEYLDGEPLDSLLDRDGKLPLAVALPILRAIARALDAAHAKGIAHRDLKPENIFLARDPDGGETDVWPKLLDFGIAKLLASDGDEKHKTRTGIPIGTPYFMSPEQCRGKDVDHRTDYYAFGILAYLILTGVRPIDADDYMTLMMNQLTEEPDAPSTVNPELPPPVDEVIAWLMKKDPSERPPNLITAIRALEQVAEEAGIVVARAPSSQVWDVAGAAGRNATPTPGTLRRAVTPGVVAARPVTRPGSNAAFAETPSAAMTVAPAAARSRLPAIVGISLATIAVGAAVFYLVSRETSGGSPGGQPAQARVEPPAQLAEPTRPAPPPPRQPEPAPGVGSAEAHAAPVAAGSAEAHAAPVAAGSAEAHAAPIELAPKRVTIAIAGVPTATEVVVDGHPIATAPGDLALDRGTAPIELVLRHAGFAPLKQRVVPDHDQRLELKLRRAGGGPSAPRGGAPTQPAGHGTTEQDTTDHDAHGIEDPFHKKP